VPLRIGLIALPAVLLWSMIAGYLVQRHGAALEAAERDSRNLSQGFEENIQRTVEAIDTTIRALRVAIKHDAGQFDLLRWERESGLSRELTLQLSVADRDGNMVGANTVPGRPVVSIADRPHFRDARDQDGDRLVISRPVLGRVSQRWSVQFVRKLTDAGGRFDGVIVASLDPAFLSRFYKSLDIGDAALLLLGRDGIVKAGASRAGTAQGEDLSGTALMHAAQEADRGSVTTTDDPDRVARIYSWRRLDAYGLIVAVGLSRAAALADYERHLVGGIVLGAALTAAAGLSGIALVRNRRNMIRSQAMLQAAVQNISQGLFVVDAQRCVPVLNGRAAELLGFPPHLTYPGVPFDDLLDWQIQNGEFKGQDASQVRRLVKSGGIGQNNASYRRTRANGTVLEFHTKVLDSGLAVRTITDVTEQERSARVLAEARDAAEAAALSRSKFLAVMSHEIRTPLNGVIGVAGILEEMELGAEQRGYVRLIRESGDHLLGLINDILDFSRLEASRMDLEAVAFNPRHLVHGIGGMLRTQALAKGLVLTVSVADSVPETLSGDPGRLRQVLLNLAGNAIKFTDSGWVTVRLQDDPAGGASGLCRLLFSVADSGIGIAPESIETMFNEFTQADGSISRRFGGSGLGLAISRRLVELMGGTIRVESELGKGSTFRFDVTLPVAAEGAVAAPAQAPVGAPGEAVSERKLRVLLAEDNPTNRLVAIRLLERMGHKADAVGNGAQAVAANTVIAYDLIVMDVMMPEMDGLAATRTIRAGETPGRRIAILGLTAGSRSENQEACLEAGMDAVTTKPVTLARLREAIAEGMAAASASVARQTRGTGGTGSGSAPGEASSRLAPGEASSRLRELVEALGEEAVRDIVATFAEDVRGHLAAMRDAAEAGETERIYRLAHSVAGAAGNIGAEALAARASALEQSVGGLTRARVTEEVTAMRADMDAALAELGLAPAV